jgi:hypothetical protein
MHDFIANICTNIGPRRPASKEENAACDVIKKECESFSDETIDDPFTTAYNAYPGGLVRVGAVLITIGFALEWTILYVVAIPIIIIALVEFIEELMVMDEFIDRFYKKGTSRNVFGKIKPASGEAKKIIIVGGHTDSAYEIPFVLKYGAKIGTLALLAVGFGIFVLGMTIVKLVLDLNPATTWFVSSWKFLGIARAGWFDLLVYIPAIVWFPYLLWVVKNYASRKVKVLGANDNLSGVAVSLALGKHLQKHRPKNVEVWCGSFGCEEAGQRGSKRFVEKYKDILSNSYTVVTESLGGMALVTVSAEKMYLIRKGLSLKPIYHDKELVGKFLHAVDSYHSEKHDMPFHMAYEATFAGTDATRFSQKGFKALALSSGGADNMFITHWHDRSDTPENVDKFTMWHAVNIIATFIDEVDQELESAD